MFGDRIRLSEAVLTVGIVLPLLLHAAGEVERSGRIEKAIELRTHVVGRQWNSEAERLNATAASQSGARVTASLVRASDVSSASLMSI